MIDQHEDKANSWRARSGREDSANVGTKNWHHLVAKG